MDIATAKKIISDELLANDDINEVYFSFFGGEPFLAFDLIKELHSYIIEQAKATKKRVCCTSTTNGTLIHGEIKDWLIKNADTFKCGLSYDGTDSLQNINRSNSASKIDLHFFKSVWADSSIKMTISPKTIEHFADGVIFLHNNGYDVACNLAYGMNWEDYDFHKAYENQLFKLVNYYLEHPTIKPCNMLDKAIFIIDGEIPTTIRKWCGSGTNMKTYDIHGNCYPCQYFMPISMEGDNKKISFKDKRFETEIPVEAFSPKCQSCKLLKACPTCMGANYTETGNLYHKDDKYCDYIKSEFLATSYLKWEQIKRDQLKVDDNTKYRLLQGIKVVQEELVK